MPARRRGRPASTLRPRRETASRAAPRGRWRPRRAEPPPPEPRAAIERSFPLRFLLSLNRLPPLPRRASLPLELRAPIRHERQAARLVLLEWHGKEHALPVAGGIGPTLRERLAAEDRVGLADRQRACAQAQV